MLERFAAKLTVNAVTIALIVLALAVQTARIEGFKVWPISVKGLKAEVANLSEKLRTISDKRNEQKQTTNRNIDKARDSDKSAKQVADRIRNAPLSGKCETPKAILEAEL